MTANVNVNDRKYSLPNKVFTSNSRINSRSFTQKKQFSLIRFNSCSNIFNAKFNLIMKTNLFSAIILATTIVAYSCTNTDHIVETTDMMQITLNTKTLSVDKEDMTRATLSDESQTDLWVYDGTTLLTHQTSTDTDFGQPTLNLTYGTHSLRVISTRIANATISSDGILSGDSPRQTFANTLALDVTPSTAATQTIELQRQTYQLTIMADDAWPADYGKLEMTIDPDYTSLNTQTFTGIAATSTYTRSVTPPSTWAGKTGCNVAFHGFTPSTAEYATTVTITLYEADNTTILQQHTVSDVPLQRNYKTTIHGALFAKEPQLSISVSSDFAGEKEVEI